MTVVDKTTLKSYFSSGSVPNGQNYIDLIDTLISGGDIKEGPGIDIVGTTVGFGGDTILVYHTNLSPVSEFPATDAGLTAVLAASIDGDIIQLPICSFSGYYVVPNGVTLIGQGWNSTIINGTVTIGSRSTLENLAITNSDVHGIIGPSDTSGEVTLINTKVTILTSSTGNVDCLYFPNRFSSLRAYGCYFSTIAPLGIGVAIRVNEGIDGDIYLYFGSAYGSAGRFSYYL